MHMHMRPKEESVASFGTKVFYKTVAVYRGGREHQRVGQGVPMNNQAMRRPNTKVY